MESKCVYSNVTCNLYPHFLFYNEKTHNPFLKPSERWDLSSNCENFKIVQNSSNCPDFQCKLKYFKVVISLMKSGTRGMNLVQSLETQPKIQIQLLSRNETNLNYFNAILGYYITDSPSNDSFGFSFIFHTGIQIPIQSPYYIDSSKKSIQFVDFSLTGARGNHKIGYVVALKYSNSSKPQCAFLQESNEIFLSMVYESFISSIHVIGMLLYIGTTLFTLILVVFCNGNYIDKRSTKENLNDDFIEEEDEEGMYLLRKTSEHVYYDAYQDEFRKFRSGGKNGCHDFLLTICRISDTRDSRTIGTEAYFYLRFNRIMIMVMLAFFIVTIPLFFIDWLYPVDLIGGHDISNLGISAFTPDKDRNFWYSFNTPFIAFHFIAAYLFLIITMTMNFFLLRLTKIYLPKKEEISQQQTIEISNVQVNLKEEKKIKSVFTETVGEENILSVHIAWELSELSKIIQKIDNLKSEISELKEIKRFRYYWFQRWLYLHVDWLNKIEMLEQSKDEWIEKTKPFKNNINIFGTGYAFISFINKEIMEETLRNFQSKTWKSENLSSNSQILTMRWKMKKAHKSSNIKWENLHYSILNQNLRKIFGTIGRFNRFHF
jgi:hypothetical protein